MATKKDPAEALLNELMGEIEGAQATRPKGKFYADGRYIVKVTGAGIQQGKKFTGWTCDGEVMSTTAQPDPQRATRKGDPAVIMWKQNDSLPGNLKAVEQALGVDRRQLLTGEALVGKLIKVTATEGTTKTGDPFTFITITGFADEGEELAPVTERAPVDDSDIPF